MALRKAQKSEGTHASPNHFGEHSHRVQSLGRWVDNLLGDRKHRAAAKKKVLKAFDR